MWRDGVKEIYVMLSIIISKDNKAVMEGQYQASNPRSARSAQQVSTIKLIRLIPPPPPPPANSTESKDLDRLRGGHWPSRRSARGRFARVLLYRARLLRQRERFNRRRFQKYFRISIRSQTNRLPLFLSLKVFEHIRGGGMISRGATSSTAIPS